MNVSPEPRRSRKPIVGAGSIIVAFILVYLTLKLTNSPLLAAMSAGIPTYIAPSYYAWKREPFKAYASAILASMVSGAVAWIVFNITGVNENIEIDALTGFLAGLITGGLGSHFIASACFVKILDSVATASPYYPVLASSFLTVSSSTALGLALLLSIRRPREVFSPSIMFISAASLAFLIISMAGG